VDLRKSELAMKWEDVLSGEEIWRWVFQRKKYERSPFKLPKDSGVYRWLFPVSDSGKPTAYIGEAEVLSDRLTEYLNEGNRQFHGPGNLDASNNGFSEEQCRLALRKIHRHSIARIGAELARKAENQNVRLQILRISEEGSLLGIELSKLLLHDKIGRVFIEHFQVLKTETEGYTMLNRNRSQVSKMLKKKLPGALGAGGKRTLAGQLD